MSKPIERVEIISGTHRRRRYGAEEKVRLVEQAMQPGMTVSAVARLHGVSPSLLFQWRRRMSEGGHEAVRADEEVVPLSRVRCTEVMVEHWDWLRVPAIWREANGRSALPASVAQQPTLSYHRIVCRGRGCSNGRDTAWPGAARQGKGVDVKAVILAGGFGTRMSEETDARPKPMIEIGGKPILWHIMKIFAHHGVTEFVICLGYKGYMIKEFFVNFHNHVSDLTVDTRTGEVEIHRRGAESWRVTMVETGLDTMTGGRLKRIRDYVADEPDFFMTYGDGVAAIDLHALLAHHRAQGRGATVTAVRPPGRFGALELAAGRVERFTEKPQGDGSHINGGFFVLKPAVLDRVADDTTVWEQAPMQSLARDGQLSAFHHDGFWQPMDTLREKRMLEELWASGRAPWKLWA